MKVTAEREETEEIKTILVVDDNSTNLKVLSQILSNANFNVAVAKDGETALKQVAYRPPDLILLDVQMPGIDGFETCKALKENPTTKEIPVIFMTALSETTEKVKGLSLGAVDYITKPFEYQEVLARINIHLKLRSLQKKLQEQNLSLEERVTERTTQLTEYVEKLQTAQVQLIHTEKMSALGELVAGIAHELNNPIGCITGNIGFIETYVHNLFQLIELYQQYYPNSDPKITEFIEEIELDYIQEDLPQLINTINAASQRMSYLSKSMRIFSRKESAHKELFDIHEGIDSTVIILQHRLKAKQERPEIKLIKQYGNLPQIECYPSQLNQVFMNLLANAIDTLEEKNLISAEKLSLDIVISTEYLSQKPAILIKIKDNGVGMNQENQERIFEEMFTTKPLGKGTGLGLSISRNIVEEQHQGKITFTSSLGEGTEFTIEIPVS